MPFGRQYNIEKYLFLNQVLTRRLPNPLVNHPCNRTNYHLSESLFLFFFKYCYVHLLSFLFSKYVGME